MKYPSALSSLSYQDAQKATHAELIFDLKNVSKCFGDDEVLTDINLRIQAGERVALVGPSGAGKTTLLNLMNGSLLPSRGDVRIFGQILTDISPRALRQTQYQIGTVYQQFHLVNNLRVIHNVNAGNLGRWTLLKAAISLLWPMEVGRALQALTQVGISEKLYERADKLSGGQQQRVALARVLVQDPLAILADEPISSVDPERSREIMNLLRRLNQTTGKTLITSLHTIEFAYSHYERIVGLRQGRVLFDTPSTEVSLEMVAALYRIDDKDAGR